MLIPLVAASERGPAKNFDSFFNGLKNRGTLRRKVIWIEIESPVGGINVVRVVGRHVEYLLTQRRFTK